VSGSLGRRTLRGPLSDPFAPTEGDTATAASRRYGSEERVLNSHASYGVPGEHVCLQQVAESTRTHISFAASFLRLGRRTANHLQMAFGAVGWLSSTRTVVIILAGKEKKPLPGLVGTDRASRPQMRRSNNGLVT
jgi:hypothetical protein